MRSKTPSRLCGKGPFSFGLALALSAALWGAAAPRSRAREPFVPTPSQLYGSLFVRVQMAALRPGNDNFVDDIPKAPPPVIMRRYRRADPRTRAALLAFLEHNFTFPARVRTPPVPADRTVSAHIARLWPLLTRQPLVPPAYSSLLYVPKPYIVPGGAFQEFYYWDSYFSMLGLIPDGHMDLARDLVDDFSYLIETYGHIPNGARTFYLSRSQPPVYYLMVGLMDRRDPAKAWASHLRDLEREYAYWMKGAKGLRPGQARRNVVAMPDGAILNRYWDARDVPRDEGYRNDVLTARASGRPPAQVYRDIRAAAESGWDFSSRWLGDRRHMASIRTTAIVPVDLNSLLYGLEEAIARGCRQERNVACERTFDARARRRRQAMDHYLWDGRAGWFEDYDWREAKRRGELTAATLYPLFVGLATPRQARHVTVALRAHLLKRGGIVTTTIDTGQQWDAPNGWAPLQWIAVRGLARYGNAALAHEIARRWLATVRRVYLRTGEMYEKYDVEHDLPGGGGEYPVQDGFGWTNGVTRALLQRYPDLRSAASHRPL
ncbi:MAG TPA: alpha,alpha-trehalase TreF [Steroidobacteraceae bacterium]|nr:alpha,alpha-trehalase TreF [Steroidobacteraceae bacterium]